MFCQDLVIFILINDAPTNESNAQTFRICEQMKATMLRYLLSVTFRHMVYMYNISIPVLVGIRKMIEIGFFFNVRVTPR